MATHLVILSETADEKSIAHEAMNKPGKDQQFFDLNSDSPDYEELVSAIFEAQIVHVW